LCHDGGISGRMRAHRGTGPRPLTTEGTAPMVLLTTALAVVRPRTDGGAAG